MKISAYQLGLKCGQVWRDDIIKKTEEYMKTKTDNEWQKDNVHKLQHTPTPWSVANDKNGPVIIQMLGGEIVASFKPSKINDANFVARAVNSHEELLNALKLAYSSLENLMNGDENQYDGCKDIIEKAITHAEGK